jgi:hypothetical protein
MRLLLPEGREHARDSANGHPEHRHPDAEDASPGHYEVHKVEFFNRGMEWVIHSQGDRTSLL